MHQQIFRIYRHLPVSRACCKISSGRPATAFPSVPRSLQRCARWSIVVGGVPKKRTNKTIKNGQTCQVCQLSKRVRIVNQDVFLPFGPLFGPCRPFWTISNKKLFFAKSTSAKPYFVLMGQQIDFCLKWSKSLHIGLKGSQIVKNI